MSTMSPMGRSCLFVVLICAYALWRLHLTPHSLEYDFRLSFVNAPIM